MVDDVTILAAVAIPTVGACYCVHQVMCPGVDGVILSGVVAAVVGLVSSLATKYYLKRKLKTPQTPLPP